MKNKILGPEISIDTANDVSLARLVRVINSGLVTSVANIAYSNGTVYANTSILSETSIIIEKNSTDLIRGTGLKASPMAFN